MAARSRNARDKVVLAYSGGLDTSVAIRWLQQKYDLDVIAVSVNVGQPGDLQEAVDRARAGGGPTLIEALTWRQCGHSRSDPRTYVRRRKRAAWMARDVIPTTAARIIERGLGTKELSNRSKRKSRSRNR